jgi:hypothetical protein
MQYINNVHAHLHTVHISILYAPLLTYIYAYKYIHKDDF